MKFYRVNDLVEMLKISKTTIYSMINANKFPRSTRIGKNICIWDESSIDLWINDNFKNGDLK
jgi:predicted DNA-binding transcriptional regulator AlpA